MRGRKTHRSCCEVSLKSDVSEPLWGRARLEWPWPSPGGSGRQRCKQRRRETFLPSSTYCEHAYTCRHIFVRLPSPDLTSVKLGRLRENCGPKFAKFVSTSSEFGQQWATAGRTTHMLAGIGRI